MLGERENGGLERRNASGQADALCFEACRRVCGWAETRRRPEDDWGRGEQEKGGQRTCRLR